MAPLKDFYEHVHKLLSTDTTVDALGIDPDNIRPGNDPIEAKAGVVVQYGWGDGAFNVKQSKGEGTFELRVSSPDNKIKAGDILEILRSVMTPIKLTEASDKVRVAKFVENPAFTDDITTEAGRHQVETDFDVRLVPA